MKFSVTVKPSARKNEVKKIDDVTYAVSVTVAPAEGKANKAVIDLLAEYFDVPKSLVTIERGQVSRKKIVTIEL